jgi:F-type H+-transporting ATPase subunit delta
MRFVDANRESWGQANSEQLMGSAHELSENRALCRALVDTGLAASVRAGVVADLFGGKLHQGALKTLEFAASLRWANTSEFVAALASAAIRAALAGAEEAGQLDQVENEIFRFSRIVAANGDLELALSDPASDSTSRSALLDSLLQSKTDPIALQVIKYAIDNRGSRSVNDALHELVKMAASRRKRLLAEVTSASALTASQKDRLVKVLEGIYGRAITLQNEIDPSVIGGIAVSVGDDLIDGTISESLEQARRSLTRGV